MAQNLKPFPAWQSPIIFDLNQPESKAEVERLIAQGGIEFISNHIDSAIEELYHIEYPAQIDNLNQSQHQEFKQKFESQASYGSWVFYSWNKTLVHVPTREDLYSLRTSRNRNLVTVQEQQLLSKATILVVGLSVGTSVIESLLLQGIGGTYILADNDQLSPSNLNRIRASYAQIGMHKVDIAAQKISETDPYIQQVHYRHGLTEENIDEIFNKYNPDIIVDEMDNLRLKILLRQKAQQAKKPVLMATDDGDDALIDIERYDVDGSYPLLHGQIPDEVVQHILSNPIMTREQAGVIIGKYFVGMEHVPLRMIESLQEVGKSLPSWPQLGSAASIAGVLVAYCAKKILLNHPLRSGKHLVGPDQSLNPQMQDELHHEELQRQQESLLKVKPL